MAGFMLKHSFSLALLFFYFLTLSLSPHQATAQPGGPQGPLPVIVAPVTVDNVFTDRAEALGTTKSNETVDITANVTEIVKEIHFEDGQQVEAGDLLVTLEKSEEEADIKAAQSLLDERKAAYKRAQGLERQQALSTATLEEREALLRQIEGDIEAIQSRISDRVIKAPFNGILGLRNISPGALVRPGDLITTIDDLSRIKVDFDVPSVFLSALKPGLKIEGKTEAFADRVFTGTIETLGTRIDPVTRTVTARAIIPNEDGLLKPGLLMNIILYKNVRSAILAPEETLIQRGKKFFVFKIEERDGTLTAAEQEVKTGNRTPGMVEIIEGLTPDERVIVHGLMQVKDGSEVEIRAVEEEHQTLEELLKQNEPAAGESKE